MAAIYDKALKRKDFSGIVDKDKVDEARERKKSAAGSCISSETFVYPAFFTPSFILVSASVLLYHWDLMSFRGQRKPKTRRMARNKIQRTTLKLGLMLEKL
jgi:hypothetical protein